MRYTSDPEALPSEGMSQPVVIKVCRERGGEGERSLDRTQETISAFSLAA